MNKKTRILVVDDNEQNLYLMKVLLESNGYEPVLMQNGNEAFSSAKADPPGLVISDILMPGLDGFALCRMWKKDEKLKKIPFIFYTATYTDIKDEELSLSLGAARFIRKPAEPSQFIDTIKKVLDEYKAGDLAEPGKPLEDEEIFYKKYNESLIRKMEDKLIELENANQRLSDSYRVSRELTYRIEAGLRAGNLAWWEMELPSGKVIFDNRKVEMIGFPPEKFKTYEDFTKLLHPADHPKAMQAMRDHLEGKAEVYEVEYRIKTRSGTYKWFRDIGAITEQDKAAGITRVIGIVEDITKRKEAELALEKYSSRLEQMVAERTQELEKAHADLIAKEKLATLGQLAGSVGHELRNPLGVINNSVYILKTSLPPENAKALEYIDLITSQIQRSNKIISDLLNYARDPIVEKTRTKLQKLIPALLDRYPPPESISIETFLDDDLPDVNIDPQQIEQVIDNILNNAYQAMPEGGKVVISSKKARGAVSISIADHGPGMSARDKQKIFTPLFTTKARGIGLGLAVAKKFIDANNGRIDVQSKLGQGSTFTISFPAAEE